MWLWGWISFFFQAEDGIRDKGMWLEFRRVLFRSEALNKSISLQKLKEQYRKIIQSESQTNLTLQVVDDLFINPYIQISKAAKAVNTTYPTAKRIIDKLIKLGILKKVSNTDRNKTYVAFEILRIIDS